MKRFIRQADFSVANKATKKLSRLGSKYTPLIALGQPGLSILNLIQETNNYLGSCTFKKTTISKKLGIPEITVKRRLKSLLDMGIVMQTCVKKIGFNKVMDKWINPQFEKDKNLARILKLLAFSVSSIITCFSANDPRLYSEPIIYKTTTTFTTNWMAYIQDQTANEENQQPSALTPADYDEIFSVRSVKSGNEIKQPKEKETSMAIPDYIKQIRSVHFSLAGQAACCAFSERTIRYADLKLSRAKHPINNRAAYFFKICHEFCRDHNILPDLTGADDMHKAMGTNDRMNKLESNGKNPDCLMLDLPSDITEKPRMSLTPTTRKPLPTGKPKNFLCPCHYRRKFNPDYVCYGVWCAQQELENMAAFLEPEPINP